MSIPSGRRTVARIAFRSNRDSNGDMYVKDASGATEEKTLLRTPMPETPTDWSRDGRFLLFVRNSVQNGQDIAALRLDSTGAEVTLLETPFNEGAGKFSPDGRWVAYVSNESGQQEVYLRPFLVGPTARRHSGPSGRCRTPVEPARDGEEMARSSSTGIRTGPSWPLT